VTTALTWNGLLDPSGRALLVVNSEPSQTGEINRVLEELDARVGVDRVWAIAPAGLRSWLIRRGLAARHVLPARIHGLEVELEFFLESEHALSWALQADPAVVVGSQPYAPGNTEVKSAFELRIAAVLGRARYITHSLPDRRAFAWTAEQLWARAARSEHVKHYHARVTRALDALYQHWNAHGHTPWADADYSAARDLALAMLSGPPEEPPAAAEATAAARRFAAERLDAAMMFAASRDTLNGAPLLTDPPKQSVADLPRRSVAAVRRPVHLAKGVKWHRTRLTMRGPVDGPYSALLWSRPVSLRSGDRVFAEGRVYRGGVTIGLVKNDGWVGKVNVDEPGAFTAIVAAREPGAHSLVVANCVKGGESENAIVIRRFGWIR
jgi:hypothetical protein